MKVSIEGAPNTVYSQGIGKARFCEEVTWIFGEHIGGNITVKDFYKNRFASVADLRAHADKHTVNKGKKLVNSQNGVLLEITKKATTTDLICHVFVVSDGMINFVNNDLQGIQH